MSPIERQVSSRDEKTGLIASLNTGLIMRPAFAIAGGKAKTGSADLGNKNPGSVTIQSALVEVARQINPVKTWAYLAKLLRTNQRVAKHRLYGSRTFTADEIALLLRSEDGIHFLVALMDDARPKWWVAVLRMHLVGSVARRREADLQMLKRFADADQTAATTLPAALRIQDPDFFEPVAAALDAITRAPAGPLAKTTKR